MSAPSSSEELQRWMGEVGEALYHQRRGWVRSDVRVSLACGSYGAAMMAILLAFPGEDDPLWLVALLSSLFTVISAVCWARAWRCWREGRELSIERPPITVESSVVARDRLSRTITVGPTGWPGSRSWTKTKELPRSEEAAAVAARHAIEDARWREAMAGGTLPEGASEVEDIEEAGREELASILLGGRALAGGPVDEEPHS